MNLTPKAARLFITLLTDYAADLEDFIQECEGVPENEDEIADASNDLGFVKALLKGALQSLEP